MLRILIIIFLLILNFGYSQNILGLWVSQSSDTIQKGGYYVLLYIKEDNRGRISGFIYDKEDGGWCHYTLEGKHKANDKLLRLNSSELIGTTEDHMSTKLNLKYSIEDNQEFLEGESKVKGFWLLLKALGVETVKNIRLVRPDVTDVDEISGFEKLKSRLTNEDRQLINQNISRRLSVKMEKQNDVTVTESEPLDTISEESVISKTEEKKVINNEVIETEETIAFTQLKDARENELLTSHTTKSNTLAIEILDNNVDDGDRISIYLNDKLIRYNLKVEKESKIVELTFPDDRKSNTILFVANNLGKFPPNTAIIKYQIDGVSYEKKLFTNEKKNKYLYFEFE